MIFSFRMVERNAKNILGLILVFILMFIGNAFRALPHIAKTFFALRKINQVFRRSTKRLIKMLNLSGLHGKNLCAPAHTPGRATVTLEVAPFSKRLALPFRVRSELAKQAWMNGLIV